MGINNLKDLLESLAYLTTTVGAGAFIWVALTYKLTKKQLNFSVITSCVTRFQSIIGKLKSDKDGEKEAAVAKYLDLCNEELFYFKNDYLPEEVTNEWLEGMIYYLPHFIGNEYGIGDRNVNTSKEYLTEIDIAELKEEYPRLAKAFCFRERQHLDTKDGRMKTIEIIKANLKKMDR